MATVGVDYGITGQVACRMAFGIRGAKWLPSVMRTIASAYWFAMQTIVGATVLVAIGHQWTGRNYSVVRTGMVLAALQVLLALVGYHWLKLISRFSLPVKVAGIIYIFWILAHGPGASYQPAAALHFHTHLHSLLGGGLFLGAVWLNSLDRGVAHHDHRRRGFLPLHAQPRRYVVGHHASRGAVHRLLGLAGRVWRCCFARKRAKPFLACRLCPPAMAHLAGAAHRHCAR